MLLRVVMHAQPHFERKGFDDDIVIKEYMLLLGHDKWRVGGCINNNNGRT